MAMRRLQLLLLGGLAAMTTAWPVGAGALAGSELTLPYVSSNAESRAPSRYGFVVPETLVQGLTPQTVLELRFDDNLDLAVYQRKLRLCALAADHGRLPSHHRCAVALPATLVVRTGPGQDTLGVTITQPIDPNQSLAIWADLINPAEPGLYPVSLWRNSPSGPVGALQQIGRWLIRVEFSNRDGDGSDV